MKTRNSVLAKVNGCLVLIEVTKKTTGKGKCPSCGTTEFRYSDWSGPEWIECCNDDCGFEVSTSHVEEVESILTSVSKTDCKP